MSKKEKRIVNNKGQKRIHGTNPKGSFRPIHIFGERPGNPIYFPKWKKKKGHQK
jgi:hypothetical protein